MAGAATTTQIGDAPFDMRAYRFTTREVCEVCNVPTHALYLWRNRNQLNVSDNSRHSSVRYSALDMVAIVTMHRVTYRIGMTPLEAAPIAHLASEMAGQFTRDRDGTLRGSPLGNNILVAFDANGGVLVGTATLGAPGHYMPPSFEADATSALREPHVVIPIAAIRRNIIERVCELTREDADD